jgi:hypothetical protein
MRARAWEWVCLWVSNSLRLISLSNSLSLNLYRSLRFSCLSLRRRPSAGLPAPPARLPAPLAYSALRRPPGCYARRGSGAASVRHRRAAAVRPDPAARGLAAAAAARRGFLTARGVVLLRSRPPRWPSGQLGAARRPGVTPRLALRREVGPEDGGDARPGTLHGILAVRQDPRWPVQGTAALLLGQEDGGGAWSWRARTSPPSSPSASAQPRAARTWLRRRGLELGLRGAAAWPRALPTRPRAQRGHGRRRRARGGGVRASVSGLPFSPSSPSPSISLSCGCLIRLRGAVTRRPELGPAAGREEDGLGQPPAVVRRMDGHDFF